MKKLVVLIIVLALIAGGWFAIRPYQTVQKLTQALEREDPVAVDLYVDFDAVRASLQNDFMLRIGTQAQDGPVDRVANSITNVFVSMLVTPQAMIMVFKDQPRRDAMGLSTSLPALLKQGKWVNPSLFILKNSGGEPTLLLVRTGTFWEVTAVRLK